MAAAPSTLENLEQFMSERRKSLRFPPCLEAEFERDLGARRAQRLCVNMCAMSVTYNAFLIGDWLLVPDQMTLAAILHIALITPAMFLAAWVISRNPRPAIREGVAATAPILIAVQILAVFLASRSPYAVNYQYLVLLPILYTNTIQRLPYQLALVVSTIIFVLYSAAIWVSPDIAAPVAIMAMTMLAACAYTTLAANFWLERDFRRTYLQSLRDRLRQEAAEEASQRDALTGLGNRRRLQAKLAELWTKDEGSVALIMVDVDHFKSFNDRYGHPAGDACLKRVASCVLAELRTSKDLAIRYGGEELLIVFPGAQMEDALRAAERVRRGIQALGIPHELAATRIITASFGVAAAPASTVSADELIAAADAALYAAKRAGRNQVHPPLLRGDAAGAEAKVVALRPAG